MCRVTYVSMHLCFYAPMYLCIQLPMCLRVYVPLYLCAYVSSYLCVYLPTHFMYCQRSNETKLNEITLNFIKFGFIIVLTVHGRGVGGRDGRGTFGKILRNLDYQNDIIQTGPLKI